MGESPFEAEVVDEEKFIEALMRRLGAAAEDDETARELVVRLSRLPVLRSYPVKPFPYGQYGPDGLGLQVVLDKQGLADVLQAIVELEGLDRFEYFPYGILDPRVFVGRLDIHR